MQLAVLLVNNDRPTDRQTNQPADRILFNRLLNHVRLLDGCLVGLLVDWLVRRVASVRISVLIS